MTNLTSPAQARIPIGTVVINGRALEVAINIEWARFIESLTAATNTSTVYVNTIRGGVDGPLPVLLAGDGSDGIEFIPGPPGPQGPQGQMGPALGLMTEAPEAPDFVPGPPGAQGQQGPPGPAIFLIQDNETNDIFWPIKAG